jgi:branched-chain amino acid transport system ATP-binding protein
MMLAAERPDPAPPDARAAAPLLSASGLTGGYGNWDVLHDVDLSVRAGEIVGILGHNGAGKTTLLKMLAGLIRPSRGRVVLGGRDVTGWPTARRVGAGLVLVPQGRALFPEMSLRHNVRLGAFTHSRRVAAAAWQRLRRAEPLLDRRAETAAGRLSGGQQQIVANMRGLAASPSVLMVDEPSLGLSGVAVANLAGFLEARRAEGMAVLLVEQNVGLAMKTCDRFLLIRSGRVIAQYGRGELPADALWGLF